MGSTIVPSLSKPPDPWARASLEELARSAGAPDLFVLRRIGADRFAHVDGYGRGVGWAGIVEIGLDEEPMLAAAAAAGGVLRRDSAAPEHAFGPYYARSFAVVPVGDDSLVVFGSNQDPVDELQDGEFRELAECVVSSIGEISPAKRLADELELVNAVRDLLLAPAAGIGEALDNVVREATAALSCEAGVLYLQELERLAVADRGFTIAPATELLLGVMRELTAKGRSPVCIQDAISRDLPKPFSAAEGVKSYYLLELEPPLTGALLLLHTESAPRGFTTLCQALGRRLVEAAGTVLSAGLAREQLLAEAEQAGQQARRDPLTGLSNRRGWEEAIAATRATPERPVSIIQLDCRALKEANNSHGHHVGDELLQALAEILRASVREGLVARLGGDEFAALLADTDRKACSVVAERLTASVAAHPPIAGVELAVAVGAATTSALELDLSHTHRLADAEMLRDKARSTA